MRFLPACTPNSWEFVLSKEFLNISLVQHEIARDLIWCEPFKAYLKIIAEEFEECCYRNYYVRLTKKNAKRNELHLIKWQMVNVLFFAMEKGDLHTSNRKAKRCAYCCFRFVCIECIPHTPRARFTAENKFKRFKFKIFLFPSLLRIAFFSYFFCSRVVQILFLKKNFSRTDFFWSFQK